MSYLHENMKKEAKILLHGPFNGSIWSGRFYIPCHLSARSKTRTGRRPGLRSQTWSATSCFNFDMFRCSLSKTKFATQNVSWSYKLVVDPQELVENVVKTPGFSTRFSTGQTIMESWHQLKRISTFPSDATILHVDIAGAD